MVRHVVGQDKRYDAISAALGGLTSENWRVQFAYQTQGIRIGGQWYPIVKMEWVHGLGLDRWIVDNLSKEQRLRSLGQQFYDLYWALQRSGIAHGDLSHGNIMVANGTLRLVDYDGLYVPALAGSPPGESGHPNYQHPDRAAKDYGPQLDNFSAWVIYGSLAALSADSSLWATLGGGDDCLLLRRPDFLNLKQSGRMGIMRKSSFPLVRAVAQAWTTNLVGPPDRVGPLEPLLGEQSPDPGLPWWQVPYTSGGRVSANAHAAPSTPQAKPTGKRIDVKTWLPKAYNRLARFVSRRARVVRRYAVVCAIVSALAVVGILLGASGVFTLGNGSKVVGHASSRSPATSLASKLTTTTVAALSVVQNRLKSDISASNDVYSGCEPIAPLAQAYQGIGCREPNEGIELSYYGFGSQNELTALFDAVEQILVSTHQVETCWSGKSKGTYYNGSNAKDTAGQWLCYKGLSAMACMEWTNYKIGTYGVACRSDMSFGLLIHWWVSAGL